MEGESILDQVVKASVQILELGMEKEDNQA